jgi:hypothetical protein
MSKFIISGLPMMVTDGRKREFDSLDLNGHNYPIWAMDIKITLESHGLVRAIQNPEDPLLVGVTPVRDEQKYSPRS